MHFMNEAGFKNFFDFDYLSIVASPVSFVYLGPRNWTWAKNFNKIKIYLSFLFFMLFTNTSSPNSILGVPSKFQVIFVILMNKKFSEYYRKTIFKNW